MLWRIMTGIAMLYGLLYLGVLVGAIVAIFRSKTITQEEEERAAMRSCSWPTDGVAGEKAIADLLAVYQKGASNGLERDGMAPDASLGRPTPPRG